MLPRSSRLRSGDDIREVVKRGQRISTPFFTLHFVPADASRFAVITGRPVGNAVERNKIKRRITSAITEQRQHLDSSIDAVFRMRKAALNSEFALLADAVKTSFERIRQ